MWMRARTAAVAGAAVLALSAWPGAAVGQVNEGEDPAGPALNGGATDDFGEGALEDAAGQVERRDLQVNAPTLGPGARISAPLGTAGVSTGTPGQSGDSSVGGIPIPATARMPGEVRYIEVPVPVRVYDVGVPDGDEVYHDNGLFIRGFVTDLHGPDRLRHRRDRDRGRGRQVSEPISGGLLPSDAVFRRAQLRFSEGATAGSSGLRRSDDVFRRAQLRFHDASTRPHVDEDAGTRRDSDRPRSHEDGETRGRRGGDRHERRSPRMSHERPRRIGGGVIAPR